MPSTGQPLHPTRAHCGLPSTCAVCGQWPAQPLCHDCIDRFAPAPRTAPLVPGPLSTCVAAVAYGYPWSGLLARLKFHDEPGWAGPLSMLMAQAGQHSGGLAACDALVPVPLSHRRLAERGYNQAWELARRLQRPALPRALPEIPAPVDQAYPGVIRYEVVNLHIRVHWAAFAIWLAQDVAYFFAKYLLSLILVLCVHSGTGFEKCC